LSYSGANGIVSLINPHAQPSANPPHPQVDTDTIGFETLPVTLGQVNELDGEFNFFSD